MGPRRTLSRALAALALLALIACLINGVYPFMWISMPLTGRVLDNTTGAPVPGAVVSATWLLTSLEGSSVGYLKVAETLTDSSGHFRIPAWGPKFSLGLGRLKGSEPQIRVLAEGYVPAVGSRNAGRDADALLRYSDLSKPIRLNRVSSDAGLESALSRALIGLSYVFTRGCEWTELPKTLHSLDRIRAGLESRGTLTSMLRLDGLSRRACPGATKFFMEREQ